MRFIPTRIHGIMDYIMGILLIGSPWFFQFDHGSAETWVPIVLGGGAMLYSLFTDYEWSVARRLPMSVHLLLDVAGGLFLAISPWLFGFAHFVKMPHVLLGLGEVAIALFTSTRPTGLSVTGTIPRDEHA